MARHTTIRGIAVWGMAAALLLIGPARAQDETGRGERRLGLELLRVDLRFANGAVLIVVPRNEPPEAEVRIRYRGSGILTAMWEIADPASSLQREPIFRPLRFEHIWLGFGGQKTRAAPPLPAQMTGFYVLRFRIIDSPFEGDAPTIRYMVRQGE